MIAAAGLVPPPVGLHKGCCCLCYPALLPGNTAPPCCLNYDGCLLGPGKTEQEKRKWHKPQLEYYGTSFDMLVCVTGHIYHCNAVCSSPLALPLQELLVTLCKAARRHPHWTKAI